MKLFALSFLVFAFSMLAMAVGVACGRRPPRRGCGELAAVAGPGAGCSACKECGKRQDDRADTDDHAGLTVL